MDELQGIRIFREIVESGGFAAAADRLNISAPMVSKHVAQLEKKLGARLLNRSSRRLSLTEAGTAYHAQCRQALDILDAAQAAAGQAAAAPRGELKISAPVWCATPRFAQVLCDYRRHYPEVRLDLHLDNHMVDLVAEGFDVALRVTAEPSPSLIARSLCPIHFHLVATPACLASWQARAVPGQPPQALDMVMPNYTQLDRLRQSGTADGTPLKLDTVMKSSDTTLSYHAAKAGMGAAFLPGWLVDADLAAGRLVEVPGSGVSMASELFAVYTSRRQMPPKLRSFIDFLKDRLGAQDTSGGAPAPAMGLDAGQF